MGTKSNTKELQELIKRIEDFVENKDEILTMLTNEIALRLWRKVRQKTPVGKYPKGSSKHGGTLRRGWTIGEITESNGVYKVEIINNVEYAPYVEFGHRTRNHKGWVNGVYMLTVSEQEIDENLDKIIKQKLKKVLKKVFE
ncbi:HK97 gp10 family phage protein [Massilimicrobiota timonensis]|uniref:HK97 gp10 family phage protein n=1 Tax=Massilimicrobiota timonensis TaxID=1776392 RepID=A0A1Y4STP0_9FIRM|nr:HK97 gp10 family phage protein [Massilimicrobiota timonensis]OUQ33247.1 hypothetical protein B5E75_10940 [Massilimicrobiota timonensis]